MRLPSAAFRLLQATDAVSEHLAFRRRSADLGDALRAYGAHHAPRATRAPWSMGDLHSIVVPCFGHAAFLEEAFASVLDQDHRPLEVIFVDDASPDASSQVLASIASRANAGVHTRVFRLRRNGGQTAALNHAILRASGDAITVLNDDDLLLPGAVSTVRMLLAQHRAHLIGGSCEIFEGATPPVVAVDADLAAKRAVLLDPGEVAAADALAVNIAHTGSTFLRSAWWTVRGYRPWARTRIVRAGDRDFQLRIGSLFGMCVIPDVPLALWRWGTSVDSERFT